MANCTPGAVDGATLTVSAYAGKYGMPKSTVYKNLYAKRIKGERTEGGWLVADAPPPLKHSKNNVEVTNDYDLTLLWLNATIMDDGVIMIRSKDDFVPSYFADKYGCALWLMECGQYACKISSVALVHSLRERGFTGRKDSELIAPDVSDVEFAAAFIESRASFTRQLCYDRRTRDKAHAYYVPAISMCASYPLMAAAAGALHRLWIIPPRQLSPAANGTSAMLRITSYAQLDAARNVLSVRGKNSAFWEQFDLHIQQPRQPYYAGK